jgi:N-acetylgalactosamine PTS system EIIA component
MSSDARRALVAGHGGFAEGLISAVSQIAGLGDLLVPVSNTGLSPQGMDERLRAALAESGARVIFTDLPAGSCTMAARRIARGDPGLVVVTGAALPTVLAWACGAEAADAVERGREALRLVEGAGGA